MEHVYKTEGCRRFLEWPLFSRAQVMATCDDEDDDGNDEERLRRSEEQVTLGNKSDEQSRKKMIKRLKM